VPVYAEVQQIGAEFEKVGDALAGTSPHSSVAILNSYDSHWAIDFQKHTQKFDYVDQITDLYRAIQPIAQGIDIVSPDADLSRYKVVFAPALNVISKATARNLLGYVQQGGHLVLGPRTGMKDEDDALQIDRQPGPLETALGGRVEQYYALDSSVAINGSYGSGSAAIWAETLTPLAPDAKVTMIYGDSTGWFSGKPAALARVYGKGTIEYVGATLDAGLMREYVAATLAAAKVEPILPGLPAGVELMERSSEQGARIWILINHGTSAQSIPLPADAVELLSGKAASSVKLAAHGVAVISVARPR
jgi:beta-galactosidase